MTRPGLEFDIHSLARVRIASDAGPAAMGVAARLKDFAAEPAPGIPARIEIAPLGRAGRLPPRPGAGRDFAVDQGPDGPRAAFFYRARPDAVLTPGPTPDAPIKLQSPSRQKAAGRIYGLFLYCLARTLAARGAMLCHASALARDGRALLLCGPRGSRKTMLMLRLLAQGWDHIGDDKTIIRQGRVLPFQTRLALRGHHFLTTNETVLPRTILSLPEVRTFVRGIPRRRAMARFCETRLPSYLRPALARFHDKALELEPGRLFPESSAIDSAPLGLAVFLLPGTPGCSALNQDQALDTLERIQALMFPGPGGLDHLLPLAGDQSLPARFVPGDVMGDAPALRLGVAPAETIGQTISELEQCLRQAW